MGMMKWRKGGSLDRFALEFSGFQGLPVTQRRTTGSGLMMVPILDGIVFTTMPASKNQDRMTAASQTKGLKVFVIQNEAVKTNRYNFWQNAELELKNSQIFCESWHICQNTQGESCPL
jgi:hypothetical protein